MDKTYEVVCDKCEGTSVVKIRESAAGKLIEWLKIGKIISARERLDNSLGWQCYCGNNTIMSQQEHKMIADPAQPTPKEISAILKDLIPEPAGFKLREV